MDEIALALQEGLEELKSMSSDDFAKFVVESNLKRGIDDEISGLPQNEVTR